MQIKLLKEAFLSMCLENRMKKNHEQITIIEKLTKFYEQINEKNSFIKNIFYKRDISGVNCSYMTVLLSFCDSVIFFDYEVSVFT